VYRMAEQDIGCSLAEAAEADTYFTYLEAARERGAPALHVVYINTSLRTKALADALVPTITCTSSNVVQTVLQVLPHPAVASSPPASAQSLVWPGVQC
jgi:quinolinate synthase